MTKLFHGSPTPKITILKPEFNGERLVFATPIYDLAAPFLHRAGRGFTIGISLNDKIPVMTEMILGAWDYRYRHISASIYTVDSVTFREKVEGPTWSINTELVSDIPVQVEKEEVISDVHDYLFDLERQGRIIVRRYNGPENDLAVLNYCEVRCRENPNWKPVADEFIRNVHKNLWLQWQQIARYI